MVQARFVTPLESIDNTFSLEVSEENSLPPTCEAASEKVIERLSSIYPHVPPSEGLSKVIKAAENFVQQQVHSKVIAEDIVGEAFRRLIRRAEAIESDEPSKIRGFLFRICSRLVIDHFRSQKRRKEDLDENDSLATRTDENSLSPFDQIGDQEELKLILAKCTPKERVLLGLRARGVSFEEIKVELNDPRSVGAIRSGFYRLLTSLQTSDPTDRPQGINYDTPLGSKSFKAYGISDEHQEFLRRVTSSFDLPPSLPMGVGLEKIEGILGLPSKTLYSLFVDRDQFLGHQVASHILKEYAQTFLDQPLKNLPDPRLLIDPEDKQSTYFAKLYLITRGMRILARQVYRPDSDPRDNIDLDSLETRFKLPKGYFERVYSDKPISDEDINKFLSLREVLATLPCSPKAKERFNTIAKELKLLHDTEISEIDKSALIRRMAIDRIPLQAVSDYINRILKPQNPDEKIETPELIAVLHPAGEPKPLTRRQAKAIRQCAQVARKRKLLYYRPTQLLLTASEFKTTFPGARRTREFLEIGQEGIDLKEQVKSHRIRERELKKALKTRAPGEFADQYDFSFNLRKLRKVLRANEIPFQTVVTHIFGKVQELVRAQSQMAHLVEKCPDMNKKRLMRILRSGKAEENELIYTLLLESTLPAIESRSLLFYRPTKVLLTPSELKKLFPDERITRGFLEEGPGRRVRILEQLEQRREAAEKLREERASRPPAEGKEEYLGRLATIVKGAFQSGRSAVDLAPYLNDNNVPNRSGYPSWTTQAVSLLLRDLKQANLLRFTSLSESERPHYRNQGISARSDTVAPQEYRGISIPLTTKELFEALVQRDFETIGLMRPATSQAHFLQRKTDRAKFERLWLFELREHVHLKNTFGESASHLRKGELVVIRFEGGQCKFQIFRTEEKETILTGLSKAYDFMPWKSFSRAIEKYDLEHKQ